MALLFFSSSYGELKPCLRVDFERFSIDGFWRCRKFILQRARTSRRGRIVAAKFARRKREGLWSFFCARGAMLRRKI